MESWLPGQTLAGIDPIVQESLATAQQVRDQNVERDAEGKAKLRQGMAKERRIAVEDAQMRHGRKGVDAVDVPAAEDLSFRKVAMRSERCNP